MRDAAPSPPCRFFFLEGGGRRNLGRAGQEHFIRKWSHRGRLASTVDFCLAVFRFFIGAAPLGVGQALARGWNPKAFALWQW